MSMVEPLVSIIIPVYNASNYLNVTIKTVLDQTYENWELILIDDASTDKSVEIISKYLSNKKIKLLRNNRNMGAALTRNKGVLASKGEYLCFLDADDLWDTEKLSKQVSIMKKHNYHFTYTGYVFSNSKCEPVGNIIKAPLKCDYKKYLKTTIIWTSTVMLDMCYFTKKDILMPNIKIGHDGSTWLRLLKKETFAYGIDEPLSRYRRSKGSLSSNKLECAKAVWRMYYKIEGLSFFKSAYYFLHYCMNAIKKRI